MHENPDDDSSDVETHAERAIRVAQHAGAVKEGQTKSKERKRKRYNPEGGKKRKGKRPGKRQRTQQGKPQTAAKSSG
ncbi:hypothetical protein WJX75_003292 [Coccomyxa subellipsoidea]|uniref:Uncharacterized protein n=1 Tax=Coccomyxa subellipsoidea TaxID=248742 RepID=A0ABR2YDR8_9CHLO